MSLMRYLRIVACIIFVVLSASSSADEMTIFSVMRASEIAQQEFATVFDPLVEKNLCEQMDWGKGDNPKLKVPIRRDKEGFVCKVGSLSPASVVESVFETAGHAFYRAAKLDPKVAMVTRYFDSQQMVPMLCPQSESPLHAKGQRCVP